MSFPLSTENWEPPDGLGYSSLRPVQLSAQGTAIAVLAALLVIAGPVMGVFIAKQSRSQLEKQRLLREQGVDATAVITRLWQTGGKDSKHMVSYRFDAGTGKASAPSKIWRSFTVDAALPIRYVPSRPDVNHPAAWNASIPPAVLPYAIAAMMLLPGALLGVVMRKQMRLLSEGRPAPGVITALRRADKNVTVLYEFQLLNGSVAKGRSAGGRRPPGVGTRCCVIYDPENPKRNAMYPMPMVKLAR
jgi:hypothetical protein